ncbi:acyltransferase domain-containing protein, partial [Streptomyces albidoflavus]
PEPAPSAESVPVGGLVPWVVSGRSEEALRAQARRLHEYAAAHSELDVRAVGRALAVTRSAFEHRAVVLASDAETFRTGLDALAAGTDHPALVRGTARAKGRTAFLFTGQGSQHSGMGRELHTAFPVFAEALQELAAHFGPHLDESLLKVMFASDDDPLARLLDGTDYAQPALFAYEVALFRLLESWGIHPDVLAGHSLGELSAACVAGVLTAPQAAALVAARGRLMQALPTDGAMIAVQATEEEARAALAGREGTVDIAALNGPASVVLSGDADTVTALADRWAARGRKTRRLTVSRAFHSPHMDAMTEEFGRIAAGLTYAAPRIPIVSDVTGELLGAGEARDPAYWVRHIRATVRFHDQMRRLERYGAGVYVEVGPDTVLSSAGEGCLTGDPGRGAPMLVSVARTGQPEVPALLAALATLHSRGAHVDWHAWFGAGPRATDLPAYPFQKRRYWPTGPVGWQAGPSGSQVGETAGNRADGEDAPQAQPDGRAVADDSPGERPEAAAAAWRALSGQERHEALLRLVRTEAACVLGHDGPHAVDPDRGFLDHGFDSVMAVRLRNRLAAATGRELATTLLFDHPSPTAVATHLSAAFAETDPAAGLSLAEQVDLLEAGLAGLPDDDLDRARIAGRLKALLAVHAPAGDATGTDPDALDEATDDEMFDLIEKELRRG